MCVTRDLIAFCQHGRVSRMIHTTRDSGPPGSLSSSARSETMELRLTVMVAVMVSIASVGAAQPGTTSQTRGTPDFRVETWGHVVAEFSARLEDYSSLRGELEKGLPPLRVTD